jgi:hypothetical protein
MTTTPTAAPRKAPPKADAPPTAATGIHSALIAASVNYGSLVRDSDNPYFKSKYLSLPALLAAVRPALSELGVAISSRYALVTGGFVIETTLTHVPSGESLSSQFPVPDMTNPQKIGSAGTFAMRYNLLQLLAIAPEDDDGNSSAGLSDPLGYMGPPPNGNQRTAPQHMPSGIDAGPNWMTPDSDGVPY